MRFNNSFLPFASAVLGVVTLAIAVPTWTSLNPAARASMLLKVGVACPSGMVTEREANGDKECQRAALHPESYGEFAALREQRRSVVSAPFLNGLMPGAYRAAIAQKQAMINSKAAVTNSDGIWAPYGEGTLIVNDPRYSLVGDGYVFNSGRIDSFDYDPVGKHLFASLGTGGIWMSIDKGQNWVSVGDNLPSQTVGSVAWSSAGGGTNGGTIIVASGDPSFGGGDYAGLGAFWSNDLGKTWNNASGVPDGVLGFKAAVDHAHPSTVYLALSKGLFRSTDAGRSYTNVALPVSADCAGNSVVNSKCQFANFVTDVVVKEAGGTTAEAGGQVLAAVGYRAGAKLLQDGSIASPGNGLYRSDTGVPGSFTKLAVASANTLLPNGFATQERTGRIAFGAAVGAAQNHNVVYAMVQDAVLFNSGFPTLDLPEPLASTLKGKLPVGLSSTLFNGLYVSTDFGSSWIRAADTQEIMNSPTSALTATGAATMYSPGVQAYYNLWIKPDPTAPDNSAASGVPTRLAFGLEEVWTNTANVPQNGTLQSGPADYQVVGVYRTSTAVSTAATGGTTTHPDQHAGIWIPDDDKSGGVTLVVGNDGGAFSQHLTATGAVSQSAWGNGIQKGFNTLLPYGLAVAKDGVTWFGLQDNGSGKVDTDGKYYETYGGDGFYVAVDPDNSKTAWEEYTLADMRYTTDGGATWTGNAPPVTNPNFANYFMMDPTDANHLITAGPEVVELTTGGTGSWVQVFTLGTNMAAGGQTNQMSTLDLQGDSAYVGFCGICDLLNRTQFQFHNGIATNVGGSKPAKRGTSDGWHFAAAKGLPNRYITAIKIDPTTPTTIYATLGGYANRQWVPPGSYLDTNPNIGTGHVYKSVDAGENFTDVSGNLPDTIASAVLLRKGQLIVGTDIGAFISSDTAGSTWTPLGGGSLPSVPIGQFQLRPGNDQELFAATYGRGIYHVTLTDAAAQGPSTLPTPTSGPVDNVVKPEGRYGGGSLDGQLLAGLLLMAALTRSRRTRLRA